MRGKYQKAPARKKGILPWVLAAILVLLLLCLLLLRFCGQGLEAEPEQTAVVKNENVISVPGYEMLTLKADTKKQTLCLPNPPQNTCVFIISLYLEDGTLLWQSGEIRPGEKSKPIVLSRPLEKGIYANAKLVYECYTDDEAHRKLNGAQMKLNLRVQE